MGGKKHAAFIGLFYISGALAAARTRLRRDEKPNFPYDPDTTSYCTWWWDNNGSIACNDMPSAWGITMKDFLRWNPSVTESCDNFLTDHSYCVEALGEPGPTTTTTTTAGPPGATQPGQIDTCNRWDLVKNGDSCDTYTKKYPGVMLQDLIDWNSEIGDRCQYLWVDYYICTGVTGFEPTGTTTGPTPTSTNGIATPTPIQPDMVDNCDAFHMVRSGDNCATIAGDYGITRAQLLEWNTGVGAGCTSLWLDYYVCVSIIGQGPTGTITTSTTTKPTNGVSTPTPTRPGMVSNCDAFHMVKDGDQCAAISKTYGITLDQLVEYNPEVKADCTGLWLGYYICVSVIGVDPSSTITTGPSKPTNGIATPTPVRPGMVDNCDDFHKVVEGDVCSDIAHNSGISLGQFLKYNPQVKADCSGLWLGYYVCVSIIGDKPTPPTTTSTPTNGISTPTPSRPGMVNNCDAFYKVKSGDECGAIAKSHGISQDQLYKWNTEIGTDCSGLWADYYICVSIVGVEPTPTTTKGNGVATPTLTQAGMTKNCNRFRKVVNGDNCESIAKKAGIKLSNFYAWNSGIGSNCKNLWLSYYVCTGVL